MQPTYGALSVTDLGREATSMRHADSELSDAEFRLTRTSSSIDSRGRRRSGATDA
jgi:hypothetical protein